MKDSARLSSRIQGVKSIWQIFMTLALISTSNTIHAEMSNEIPLVFFHERLPYVWRCILLGVMTLLYLATFARFYLGDNHYVDLLGTRFVSVNHHADKPLPTGNRSELSGTRCFLDTWFLAFHGMIFFYMGMSIAHPHHFIGAFACLLGVNIIWLSINLRLDTHIEFEEEPSSFDERVVIRTKVEVGCRDDDAPRNWVWINLATLVALTTLSAVYMTGVISDLYLVLGFLIIASVNTLLDFGLTWSFYFGQSAPVQYNE